MKTTIRLAIFVFLLISLLDASSTVACTIISASNIYSFTFDGTYETADNMLSKGVDQDDLTVEFMASVLNATHRNMPFNTRFSVKTLFSRYMISKTFKSSYTTNESLTSLMY